jgi:hypothetical protein
MHTPRTPAVAVPQRRSLLTEPIQQPFVRIVFAVIFGLIIAWYSRDYLFPMLEAGDLEASLYPARQLLAGGDPYATAGYVSPDDAGLVSYPLLAFLVVLPLAFFSDLTATMLFVGCSTALLVFVLLRQFGLSGLLVLGSVPFINSIGNTQWAPLLLAVANLPLLLPLAMAKPNVGLVVILPNLSRWVVLLCAAFGLLSLLVMPDWPLRWLAQLTGFESGGGFVPLAEAPWLLLLAAALGGVRLRQAQQAGALADLAADLPLRAKLRTLAQCFDKPLVYLLLLLIVPQRSLYDQLLLFLTARSWRGLLLLALVSWLGFAIELHWQLLYLTSMLLIWRRW